MDQYVSDLNMFAHGALANAIFIIAESIVEIEQSKNLRLVRFGVRLIRSFGAALDVKLHDA